MPSSPFISQSRSTRSSWEPRRSTIGRYRAWTEFQSWPAMSSVQKKSRCSRQDSSKAWPQTLTGSRRTRIRFRSTLTSWPDSSSALIACRADADLLVLDQDHLLAVAGEPVAVEGLDDGGAAALGQVEADQAGGRVLVLEAGAAVAGHAGQFVVQPEQGSGGGAEVGVVALRHGDADDAVRQALRVDGDREDGVRTVGVGVLGIRAACRARGVRGAAGGYGLGQGDAGAERRRRLRGEGHQVRLDRAREGQVEGVPVVDRVEAAVGEEGQVLAVGGEDRGVVPESAVGDVDDRLGAVFS